MTKVTIPLPPWPPIATPRLMRTWTIESVGARPHTVNKTSRSNWRTWMKHVERTRATWKVLAEAAGVQHIDACTITVTPLHANFASPQDVAACAPEAKAAIDGLVDAGLLDDDGPTHVLAVLFLPPRVCGANGLELVVEERVA